MSHNIPYVCTHGVGLTFMVLIVNAMNSTIKNIKFAGLAIKLKSSFLIFLTRAANLVAIIVGYNAMSRATPQC